MMKSIRDNRFSYDFLSFSYSILSRRVHHKDQLLPQLVFISYQASRQITLQSKMKFTTTVTTLSLLIAAGFTSAWHLTIYTTTAGQYIESHGTSDSGCNAYTIAHTAVNRAKFDPATPLHSDPETFELYSDTGCTQKVYVNGEGDYTFAARTVKAYKVF